MLLVFGAVIIVLSLVPCAVLLYKKYVSKDDPDDEEKTGNYDLTKPDSHHPITAADESTDMF